MYEYRAEVIRWVDGDTVLVCIDLGFHCQKVERIRLARINVWELNDPSSYKRRASRSVRFKINKFCPPGSEIKISTKKNPRQDMYARYIAEVYFKGKNLSDEILQFKGVRRI